MNFRDKLIPLAWLMAACILVGLAAGARCHAEPLKWLLSVCAFPRDGERLPGLWFRAEADALAWLEYLADLHAAAVAK